MILSYAKEALETHLKQVFLQKKHQGKTFWSARLLQLKVFEDTIVQIMQIICHSEVLMGKEHKACSAKDFKKPQLTADGSSRRGKFQLFQVHKQQGQI